MKNYINTQENEDIMVQYLTERENDYKGYIMSFVENLVLEEEIEIDIDGDRDSFKFETAFFDKDTLNFWFSTYKDLMIRYLEKDVEGYDELETERTKRGIKIKKVGFLLNKTKILQTVFERYVVIEYFIDNRVDDIIQWELGGEDMLFDFENIGISQDDENYKLYEEIYKSAEEDRIEDVISDKNIEDECYEYSTYKNRGNDNIIYVKCKEK